jgi:5,10-methenyltetrahydrofolate synthetase
VAERKRLIDQRLAMSADERTARTRTIAEGLDRLIGAPQGRIVSLYWPFWGEPDLRQWSEKVIAAGGRIALPVVIAKAQPLEFRLWAPGEPLERGVWNILVPSGGRVVEPDIVVSPVVALRRCASGPSSSGWAMPAQDLRPSIRIPWTFPWMQS